MNKEIYYKGTNQKVCLGDKVWLKTLASLWFCKEYGVVSYVPGVSPYNKAMHFNGISQVCVSLSKGGACGVNVDHDTGFLVNRVHLLSRNEKYTPIEGDPFEEE
jgi:hypothetical protein